MAQALHAAHFNLPEMPFQIPVGSDLMKAGNFWKQNPSAFSGEPLGQARRLDVDLVLLHAQRADRSGNIEIQGSRGFDSSVLGAAKRVLVTVEEVVQSAMLGAPRAFLLPKEFVTAVAEVPWGAYPTSCLPYYSTDHQELLNYVETEQRRSKTKAATPPVEPVQPEANNLKAAPDATRRTFLSACAHTRTSDLNPDLLSRPPVNPPAPHGR